MNIQRKGAWAKVSDGLERTQRNRIRKIILCHVAYVPVQSTPPGQWAPSTCQAKHTGTPSVNRRWAPVKGMEPVSGIKEMH